MIEGLAGNKLIPASIRQDIIERTDGISLFIELRDGSAMLPAFLFQYPREWFCFFHPRLVTTYRRPSSQRLKNLSRSSTCGEILLVEFALVKIRSSCCADIFSRRRDSPRSGSAWFTARVVALSLWP